MACVCNQLRHATSPEDIETILASGDTEYDCVRVPLFRALIKSPRRHYIYAKLFAPSIAMGFSCGTGWLDDCAHYMASPTEILEFVIAADPGLARRKSDKCAMTLLHYVATLGVKTRVQMLLDAGSDTRAVNSTDRTPAIMARFYGYEEIAEMIENWEPIAKPAHKPSSRLP